MSRRRLLELLVAAGVFLLLLAIVFVRPTSKRTGAPASIPLFVRALGAPPDFGNHAYSAAVVFVADSARALVLYPLEFEQRADIYVMDRSLADGYRLVLDDSLHADESPKAAGWIDAAHAWVVIGYTMGTVSPGGDLYEFVPETGGSRLLWASPDSGRTQAVSFTPPSTVQLRTFDANMMPRGDSTLVLPAAALAEGPSSP
jgi:hypothetical protein